MSEIVVESNTLETVIEIEGGPVLETTVGEEMQTVISVPAEPVIIDLNSGARGEPGSAILAGEEWPSPTIGSVGDAYVITGDNEDTGSFLIKGDQGWVNSGSIRGPAGGIDSVNGYTTPNIVLVKSDIGLGNVDNTSDTNKPVSTATQTALNLKQDNLDKGNAVSGVDWNTYVTNGVYKVGYDTAAVAATPNFPTGAYGFGSLHVIAAGVNSVSQAYYPHNSSVHGAWVRTKWNAADWTAWTPLANLNLLTKTHVGLSNLTNVAQVDLSTTQNITGAKTFSSVLAANAGITTTSLTASATVNVASSIELGRVDGTGNTPFIDFHAGATAIDYDARIIASGGTGANGQGTLTYTAATHTFSGVIGGNGSLLTSLNGSNISSGTVADARLSSNVALLSGTQTFSALKKFDAGIAITPGASTDHGFISFYGRSATPTTRSGYFGIAAAGSTAITLKNEMPDGAVVINSNGFGVISMATGSGVYASAPDGLFVNDIKVATEATAALLTGAQTIAGVKTFSSAPVVPDSSFTIAKTTGLQTALDGKSPTGHGHALTDANITGILPDARTRGPLRAFPGEIITDWNNATTTGWWMASSAANAPTAGWFIGHVMAHNDSYTVQELSPFTQSNFINGVDSLRWRRVRSAGVWGPWHRLRDTEQELDNRYSLGSHAHDLTGSSITGVLPDDHLPSRLQTNTYLTPVTDWNDVRSAGWFNGNNAANAPKTGNVLVRTITLSTNYVIQEAFDFQSSAALNGSDTHAWRRIYNNTSWSPWYRILMGEAELDNRFANQMQIPSSGGTSTWMRIASVDGQGTSNGGHIVLHIAGQGNFGSMGRTNDIVTLSQRGAGGVQFIGQRFGDAANPWQYFYKQGADNLTFELWAQRVAYDSPVAVTVLSKMGDTKLLCDSSTSTNPGGAIAAFGADRMTDLTNATVRVVHGGTASTARPGAKYVEWVGSVSPTNATTNDTWVNTA